MTEYRFTTDDSEGSVLSGWLDSTYRVNWSDTSPTVEEGVRKTYLEMSHSGYDLDERITYEITAALCSH